MQSLLNRSTLAVVLAPAFAAGVFSAWDFVQRPETGGELTLVYFAFAYASALPAGAIAMLVLKAWDLTRIWHFALAGLLAGFLCALLTVGTWPEAIVAIIVIGPLVGVFVWFLSEWRPNVEPSRDPEKT